ncbi:MAG TPA: TetR/AcrR family transcriptional regulator [Acidimicrobiales bacterium]
MNGPPPASPTGSAATTTRLLEATRRCIVERGVAGTTSREIAAAAGTNLQAITYHYGSKDELVARALVESVREWVDPALVELRGDGDPAARLLTAVQVLTAGFEARRAEAPALLEALVQANRLPRLREAVVELWDDLRTELADQVTQLHADGHVPDWVDPPAMAGLLVAVAHGLVLQVTVDPDGPSMPEMATQFAALLVQAGRP